MSSSSSVEKTGRKYGCLIWIVCLLLFYGVFKGCSAYRNRPAGLYQRWLGAPVPEDVSELKGGYTFQLTESIAWLSFKAPPKRIEAIVKERGLILVEADPHWSVFSGSRTFTDGKSSRSGRWIWRSQEWHDSIPADQQIYWISNSKDTPSFDSGWALYYSPSTQEAFYALETI